MASGIPAILGRDTIVIALLRLQSRCSLAFLAFTLTATLTPNLHADEPTRRAQEELRKRNLYFGEVDGKMKPELVEALKHSQARTGFDVTGGLDEATANSLNIPVALSTKSRAENWPDIPVLKSDAARAVSPAERNELQDVSAEAANAPANSSMTEDHPAPVHQSPGQDVTKLVQDYLRDAQADNVELQVRYYAFPVDYFDHGRVERDFVAKDTSSYVKRWPHRTYTLSGPVTSRPSGNDDGVNVEFTISFEVRNKKHAVTGKTKNFWVLKPQDGNLKIVAIKEQRLHE
jgi:hypothetical protein